MAWKDWGQQKKDFFLSKTVVTEGRKKANFSMLGTKENQPKHMGEDLYKYVEYPIVHDMNKNDKGIDANGVKLVKDKWYAYDENGAMTGDSDGYDELSDAKNAAGDTGSVLSGNGNLYGGDTDFAVISGAAFPALRETGGLVNRVGMTRTEISTKVTEYGIYTDFTEKELAMTDDAKLLTKKSRELGIAMAEIREKQIEIGLLNEANEIRCGVASSIDEIGMENTVTISDIRGVQEYLKRVKCPTQTKVIDGSQNVDTVVVGKGYFAYFPMGLLTTLEESKDADGVKVWRPVESYMNAATYTHEDEAGKISNTRFIEVADMAIYKGMGAKTDADDDGDDDAGSENYQSSTGADGKNRYDVYPILYVGTDSFCTVGFSGDVAKVKHAMPQIIPGVDAYGKNGIVSCSFYNGLLVYRPERIVKLLSSALIG